jgi:tetratricopeptide (TPR) repeat protein
VVTSADTSPFETSGDTVHLDSTEKPATTLPRGSCVGRFVVVDVLGEGGMGIVYKAYDPVLDRPIALKLLAARGDAGPTSVATRERVLREAQALARVAHPNVIAVHDVGTFDEGVYIATEYVEGRTLRQCLEERATAKSEAKASPADLRAILLAAGEGLAAAHRAGLVHRDFKPENVIVGNDGRVRVIDFGLARAATAVDSIAPGDALHVTGENVVAIALVDAPGEPAVTSPDMLSSISGRLLSSQLTMAGAVMGTPVYMAPEQHLGRSIDARCDQFSFCIVLYEAVYGRRPFGSRPRDASSERSWRVEDAPPGAKVPRALRKVVLRGLSERPDARYPSMDALLAELRRDRHAATRRWLAAGAATAALVMAAVAYRHVKDAEGRVCQGGAAKVDAAWDRARARAIHDAFVATGAPFAEDAYRGVEKQLDAFTSRWASMHTEACEATRVRGEQSEELLDLRMQCLDERLEEVRVEVDVFRRADRKTVENAVQATHSLTSLDGCADTKSLRAPVRPPDAEGTRARVEAIRQRLAEARAFHSAGKYADGMKSASAAVADARPLGYRPVEAESLLVLGTLQDDTGDYKGAERSLRDAARAAEAGRHDEVAARARTAMAFVTGKREGRYEEAHEMARDAEAKIDRLERNESLLGELLRSEGSMYFDEAKYAQALDLGRRALDIRQRTLGPDHPLVAESLRDLADVSLEQARYDDAADYDQRALDILQRSLGPDHPSVARVLINLGGVLRTQGSYDEALATYRRAQTILARSFGPDHPTAATVHVNLGTVQRLQGHDVEAAASYERARAIWEKALGREHPNVATAHYYLGVLAAKRGLREDARASYATALAIWEKALGAQHPSLAVALVGIGDVLRESGKPEQALVQYQRALGLVEKALGPAHPELVQSLLGIGEVYAAERPSTRARAPLERALAIREAHPGDPTATADVRFALARVLGGSDGSEHDRDRARALATEARDAYTAAGARAAKKLAEVDAWLAARR